MTDNTAPRLAAAFRLTNLALVFVGGTVGVLARELLLLAFVVNTVGDDPAAWSVFTANMIGAFLLAVLFMLITHGGEDERSSQRRESMRLFLGTGVLGGFTTYSALAQIVSVLLLNGDFILALVYGLGTVFGAAVMTWLGFVVGRAIRPVGVRSTKPGGES